jgi:hypothetical protein
MDTRISMSALHTHTPGFADSDPAGARYRDDMRCILALYQSLTFHTSTLRRRYKTQQQM